MKDLALEKDRRILVVLRKVLAQIVRETTPQPGIQHPLSKSTIEDIRQCFALISAREQELAEQAGIEVKERPVYPDQQGPDSPKPVSIKRVPPATEHGSD